MTLSHVGLFLTSINEIASLILTLIGALAFPIFLFLLVEGLIFTKSHKKYLFRLLIMAAIIFVSIISFSFIDMNNSYNIFRFGNIFIDLALFVLIYIILKSKNKINLLFFIPILGFFILTYLIKIDVISLDITLYKVLGGLFPQYSLYGLLMFLCVILFYYLYDKKVDSIDPSFKETPSYYFSKNGIFSIIICLFTLISYALTYTDFSLGVANALTTYIILASIFILFYNHKKTYESKSLQYFFYLYYPLHIVIIFLIFTFIF